MVSFEKQQIFIDGQPIFLLSGELHYFRQPRENWQHLIDEAKSMGLNCIASYVPWILHEESENHYNFIDNLDLAAFIDLCKENNLYFFVRPGPFVMAEIKNEGLPYWIAQKYPDALPTSFDHINKPSTTLDYLHPGYLKECAKWYKKIMSIIQPRLHCNGGNIIGLQLDNEVGMLNWVTNTPLLNDHVLERFIYYLKSTYTPEHFTNRYGFTLEAINYNILRSPHEHYSVAFHFDFGKFMRHYYAEYILILKRYALDNGIKGIPFFINIHGTGEGRIFDFPLGISQLYEAYNSDEGMISGTDVYLGEPTEGTYQDLYVINALTSCMNKKGNPLTSIEFECSDGPYCSLSGRRYHPSATSHKMLMCLSQNARMLSFYVFSGGENYLLAHPHNDANGRMAFTGEKHGYNAPIQPDGSHNFSFSHIASTAQSIHTLNHLIATSYQVTDPVSLAFIPDYFLTELQYNHSESISKIHSNLKRFRCSPSIDHIGRALLDHHVAFDAVDIQHEDIPTSKALVLLSARYMNTQIQTKLIEYISSGGNLLLYGELPEFDLEGNPCDLLIKALNLPSPTYQKDNPPTTFLTASSSSNHPDLRITSAQCFPNDGTEIITLYGTDQMCGMIKTLGNGKICAITCDYPNDLAFFKMVFKELSITASIEVDYYRQGIYISRTRSQDNQELLYILNLDAEEKSIDIHVNKKLIFENFYLKEKACYILPLKVKINDMEIINTTSELINISPNTITLRPTQKTHSIILRGTRTVLPDPSYQISIKGEYTIITTLHSQTITIKIL
ncbi:beta-galactosidase [Niameybacter massiliensis]|uniref:beta-galactosidase n=1 Tax=Niameybacter massiliensis TaxID=1658108 RepID=UPI0006B45F2B|nr:beta-galactosidase [Niameybacter massiliensis]